MKNNRQHELISAYFDGELSGSELEAAERLLENSAEARAELATYRALSKSVQNAYQGLDRIDLSQSVLLEIRNLPVPQVQPLPTGRPVPVAQPNKSRVESKPRGFGSRFSRYVAVVSGAAAVALAVLWLKPAAERHNNEIAAHNRRPNHATDPLKVNEFANPGKIPESVTNDSENRAANEKTSISAAPAVNAIASQGTPVIDRGPGGTIASAGNPESKTQIVRPRPVPLNAQDLPVAVIEDLKKASFGQMIRFLKHGDKEVAVFHLMVVDVHEGAESLQMILSAQQISDVDGKPVKAEPDVVGVYVQANQLQMEKVLSELQRDPESQFVALAVQSPMPSEKVDGLVKDANRGSLVQSITLKESELKTAGVRQLNESELMQARRNRSRSVPTSVADKNAAAVQEGEALRKVLIVLEKIPAGFGGR